MKKLKIFSIIILSYFIADFLNHSLFIASTPKLNPFFTEKITAFFSKAKQAEKKKETEKNYIPISKGIYAKELEKKGDYLLIVQNEVDWVIYKINIKGREVKIKVPKDQEPPPKEILERLNQ